MPRERDRAPSPVLSLTGVTKRYRGGLVLSGVTVEVAAGAFVQVRGENGSGKSTLLRIATGFVHPTGGTVHRGSSSLGYVPDQAGMPARLTTRSYLSALARIRGLSTTRLRSRIEELHERLAVRPGLDEPLAALSKGNRQKALLMQAFLAPADLLLMDEPTTALDDAAIAALRELLTTAMTEGCGVLAASHDDTLDGLGITHCLHDGTLRPLPEHERNGTGSASVFVRLSGTGEELANLTRATRIAPTAVHGTAAEYTVDAAELPSLLRAALDADCEILTVSRRKPS